MGLDEAKGRLKESAGRLVGDRRLEREGKIDRVAGRIKDKVNKVRDRLKGKTSEDYR